MYISTCYQGMRQTPPDEIHVLTARKLNVLPESIHRFVWVKETY